MIDPRSICAVLLAVVLAGCGGPELDDLREFTSKAHAGRKPKVEPLPEIRPHKGFIYTASELVDPFSPQNLRQVRTASSGAGGRAPDLNRRREPLENFPLDALQMLGTLSRSDATWVIVGAPDGTVHHARKGNYIGQNFGVITDISEERILIKELIQDPNGNWIEREARLSTTE